MDPKILENRLLLRESTVGSISVSKCANRLQALKSSSSESKQLIREAFIRDIMLYSVEMNRIARILTVCDEEMDEYRLIEHELTSKIVETEESIVSLETSLKQERVLRKHKQLIESLSIQVNEHEPRSFISKEIQASDEGLRGVEDSLDLAEQQILTRKSQLQDLLRCIDILGSSFAIEESNEMDVDEGHDDADFEEDEEKEHASSRRERDVTRQVFVEEEFQYHEDQDAEAVDDSAHKDKDEEAAADAEEQSAGTSQQ